MNIKKIVFGVFWIITIGIGFAQERILSYHTDIKIDSLGELRIEEKITVQAEGRQIKRGIYRTFPTTYDDKVGTKYKVGFEVLSVVKDGEEEPYTLKSQSNGVAIYIGDENTFLPNGQYTYTLVFKTTRQIGFFETFDELYFNVIGGDWQFTIEKASVTVYLPPGAKALQQAAYMGKQGDTRCDCSISSDGSMLSIVANRALYPQEQLTIAVAWPKGFVKEPSTKEKWLYFLKTNLHVGFSIFALVLVFSLYYRAWKKVGVDPPKGTIFPLFDPPTGFSPAAIAILHVMKMTQRAFTACIISLAVKGYVFINYSKKKYTLSKSQGTTPLTKEEEAMHSILFQKNDALEISNKHHAILSKARTKMYEALLKELKPTYFNYNSRHLLLGIIASFIAVVIAFMLSPSPVIPFFLMFLLVILVVVFTYLIKAPTVKGRVLMDEVEGFKMYIKTAEQDQLDALHPPEITPERYEALLPYAIALGVENQWGKKFEKELSLSLKASASYSPTWYMGTAAGLAFSPSRFSSDMGKSFSTAIAAASAPPGSSSGSGGGGSAGGGGGGGGGGGW